VDAPGLQVSNVSKRYGGRSALEAVSLEVAPGECVALVGESGSGKTTLLRCFNRMVEPDQGTVRVGGADVREVDAVGLRRSIGYVQQEGGLLPHWTVSRNVELVPWLRAEAPERARALGMEALKLVGLEPEVFSARWPRQLSGGQRQRVALARALATRPKLVLLDEPFGALDALTRSELQDTVLGLRRGLGMTMVLVTHDLREALLLADRLAVMRQGRIEQVADGKGLLERPGTEYVAQLLSRARIVA
jgi:osmoprotectant transport system ATP-binding protein